MPKLIIEISEIRGKCPVYNVGDKIVIDGPEIVLERTDAVCIHALAPLLHYVVALRDGADPRKLGLSKKRTWRTSWTRESLIPKVERLSLNAIELTSNKKHENLNQPRNTPENNKNFPGYKRMRKTRLRLLHPAHRSALLL